jgi:DNA-binding beta-propeller fold protein YncE
VNLATGGVRTIVESGLGNSAVLATELGGSSVLLTSSGQTPLFRVNLITGEVSIVASVGGLGLAVEAGGATALVATSDRFGTKLLRVDLATGGAEIVASGFRHVPSGVAIEPGGQTALVTTLGRFFGESGEIYRVNLSTGSITELSVCPECGLTHITVEPINGNAFFLGDNNQSVIRFDRFSFVQSRLARSDSPLGMILTPDADSVFTVAGHSF